jgi:high affinity sulfate transporter 1
LTEVSLSDTEASSGRPTTTNSDKNDLLISFEGLNDLTLDAIKFGDVDDDDDSSIKQPRQSHSKDIPLKRLTSSQGSDTIEISSQSPSSETKWQKFKQRCPYYVPIFYWLPRYQFKRDFPRDLIAGLTVGSLMLPQCIAVAILATLDPIYGLYTALVTPLVYAILGTSRQLSVGPDTMVSLLVAVELSRQRQEVDHGVTAHVFAFIVGIFLFTLGLLRFGFLDNVISRPLLSGFVNAVALIIWISQLEPLLGLIPNNELTGWEKLPYIWENRNRINYYTLLLGVSAIIFMGGIRVAKSLARRSKKKCAWIQFIPETLLALIFGIGASYFFNLQQYGVQLIGSIQANFPVPKLPNFTSISEIEINIMSSLTIAVIGFIESIIVAKLYANKNNYYVSPNRELVAVGMANIVGSFFGTYPAFGSLTRSSVANLMGAVTQLYAIIGSLLIFGTIILLQADIQLFWYLPKVILAAVIIIAASGLVEVNDILFMWRIKAWKDLLLFLLTFCLTVVLGLDLGIFIALGVSVFLVIRHSSLPHIAVLGRMPKSKSYRDIAQFPEARIIPGIIIVRIEESLYFANIEMIKQMLARIESVGSFTAHPADRRTSVSSGVIGAVIIHARYISSVDASAIEVLSEMAENYRRRGIFLAWVKLRENLKEQFLRAGIIQNTLADVHLFNKIDDAVRFVKKKWLTTPWPQEIKAS